MDGMLGIIHIDEIKAQVKSRAICTDCLLKAKCLGEYPYVGCPALRFLERIAEEGIIRPQNTV